MVQCLRPYASTARGSGSIRGQGTQIPHVVCACKCAKSLQSFPTLFNPMDYSLPDSFVQGILQGRILQWVAIPGDLPDPGMEPKSPALQTDS